jgi:hypothetical protein
MLLGGKRDGNIETRSRRRGEAESFFNPNGIVASSPRLARSAYLGCASKKKHTTPTALRPGLTRESAATALRLKRFFWTFTQGSSFLATLGWGPESRWDSERLYRERSPAVLQ